jgi:DNA-binding response OmpR family regulator
MSLTNRRSDVADLNGLPVLVVEDTWHVAKAMKSALEQLGMQVIGPAATCAEAKRLMVKKKPKMALVDVNLKRETAYYTLIDELHAQSVQVIVVSGYAAPLVSKGVAALLQKPFSGSELITTLCAVVHLAR